MALDVDNLGQVFTEKGIVSEMLMMRKNRGRVLEPSAGAGAFSDHIPGCVAIEFDPRVCPPYALNMDFFAYPVTEKFDTIIGNPPYVKSKQIMESTKALLDLSLFDARANLYLFFIEKCIHHLNDGGELIFITPRDFLKATSAAKLNDFIFDNGTITHIIDLGDKPVFPGFSPNCIIFRFEKGNFTRLTNISKRFASVNGQLMFTSSDYTIPFADIFMVKVGAVSGADEIFTNPKGNREFVCSKTIDTGATRRMFYGVASPEIEAHKDTLLARRIRRFTEDNWWEWGRGYFQSDAPRIYVNAKTRRAEPFFTHECTAYDGSMLAIFPKNPRHGIAKYVEALNKVDWEELGFVCDGRFLFSQRSLEGCHLPESFRRFLPAATSRMKKAA